MIIGEKMTGLTNEEVKERIAQGKVNVNENPNTRTYRQIILENTLTFFNFLNVALLVLLLFVRSYKNTTFMGVIFFNTIIGIIQEVRAKKTLDKLAILTESKAIVLREGKKWNISTEKLVLDDLIFLKTGDQIPADSIVLEGILEVNEALLTGESDNLTKTAGDELFSGSFVTSGEACCKVLHVGKENYAAKITREAKVFKRHPSQLRNSLNVILKVISIIIVPLGCFLFYKQYFVIGDSLRDSVVNTVAAVLGMIPEGLVLLTSVALTIGTIVLAGKKTLVQELYCIETLARVDTLCLDKTGTLTEGRMCVEEIIPFPSENISDETASLEEITRIMGNLMRVLYDQNATAEALREYFVFQNDMSASYVIPFSSERKYSGAIFERRTSNSPLQMCRACVHENVAYFIGAAQFLFPEGNQAVTEKSLLCAQQGFRVLVLAKGEKETQDYRLPSNLKPLAWILLTDVIRKEAPDTLRYFENQCVDLKIISGDDPVTVSAIAQKAGLKNADVYVDAETLQTQEDIAQAVKEYCVFGRVTPQQKKAMVQALKQQGHIVAMTGDGVNDVLALKESDCSIAMAQGSDAAKNIANIVLLDSNFSSMPHIVNQGRRVINNIRTAASMFLIKTIFSVCLCILTILFGKAYPFEPIQMSLISACAVGIPTFLLAQENNFEKIDHSFLSYVFMNAFPAALTITSCVFALMLVCQGIYRSSAMLSTACVLVTGWNYMATLRTIYAPLNRYRKIVIYGMQLIFFIAAMLLEDLLSLRALEFRMIVLVFTLMTFSPILIDVITGWLPNFRK